MASMNPELASAIIASAKRLGVDPLHIGTAISYETGGKFDPNLWGGASSNHLGLIQFGPEERAKYGVKEGQSAPEQMQAVENYLRDRGVKPGMGLADIYSTINAGAPGLYKSSDARNGGAPGTVQDKVDGQMAGHVVNARNLLGDGAPVGALATAPSVGTIPVASSIGGAAADQVGALASAAPPAAVPPTMAQSLGTLGKTLAGPAAQFDPVRPLQIPQANTGQSQQIAAALARAYGIGA